MFQISTGDARPLVRQIVDAVRLQIAAGELLPGDALPSVRGLAQQLAINPNTVAKAYGELVNEGWLDARQGLGLFVAAPRQRLSLEERERRLDDAVSRLVQDVLPLGFDSGEVVERVAAELRPLQLRRSA